MNSCGDEFKVNENLLRLVQPYSEGLLEQLKQSLIDVPEKRIVHVWNGLHLDDMEIYKICVESGFDFVVQQMDFIDLNYAAIYVCKNQLKRLDLSAEYNKYLIGQLYYYEYAAKSSSKSNDSQYSIAETIAAYTFIHAGTVRKYAQYSLAINEIFEQDIAFARSILSGKLRLSHENTIELARLRPEKIRAVAKTSMEENISHITLSYIRNEVQWSHVQTKRPVSRRERSEAKARNKVTIRQMPEYYPDAEVNSLCLTIDSWISSIHRVKSSDSFPKISNTASLKLMKKLTVLEHTVNIIQESLVERTGYNE